MDNNIFTSTVRQIIWKPFHKNTDQIQLAIHLTSLETLGALKFIKLYKNAQNKELIQAYETTYPKIREISKTKLIVCNLKIPRSIFYKINNEYEFKKGPYYYAISKIINEIYKCSLGDKLNNINNFKTINNNNKINISFYIHQGVIDYYKYFASKYNYNINDLILSTIIANQDTLAKNSHKKVRKKELLKNCIPIYLKLENKSYKYFKKITSNQNNIEAKISNYLDEMYLCENMFSLTKVNLDNDVVDEYPINSKLNRPKNKHYRLVKLFIYKYTFLYFKYCGSKLGISSKDLMISYLETCSLNRVDEHGIRSLNSNNLKTTSNISMERTIILNKNLMLKYC
ncbi:MAG: hypothetical protein IJU40_01295 [Desulfovibrionaceae bacterium]|nr:hypothetical protein [Desulfovibrionaceae bacterium]